MRSIWVLALATAIGCSGSMGEPATATGGQMGTVGGSGGSGGAGTGGAEKGSGGAGEGSGGAGAGSGGADAGSAGRGTGGTPAGTGGRVGGSGGVTGSGGQVAGRGGAIGAGGAATGGRTALTGGTVGTGGRAAGTGGAIGSAGGAIGAGGGGGAGGCAPNLACKPAVPTSTGDLYQDCVNRINQFLTQCACLPALTRATDGEACADQMAEYDANMNSAHAGAIANICQPNGSQNECPGYSSNSQVLSLCMQQMWDEGPPPTATCTGSCYETHGHYINMTDKSVHRVACGFFTTSTGKVWAAQNFLR